MIRQSGFLHRGGCALSQSVVWHVSLSQMDLQIFFSGEILAKDETLATGSEFSVFGFVTEVEGPWTVAI